MAIRISSLNHCLTTSASAKLDQMHLEERQWFAVRTSNRHEKRACEELRRLEIECYLPLREKVCVYATKRVTRQLPLLSGYIFVYIHKGEDLAVRRAVFTSRFVTIGGERRAIEEGEIDLLRKLSTDRNLNWDKMEDAFDFKEGTPVEIITGPLAGIRGHYVTKKSKKIFVIAIGGMGACLSTCEIDPRYLVTLNGTTMVENEEALMAADGKKILW